MTSLPTEGHLTPREKRVIETIDALAVFGGTERNALEPVEAINARRFSDLFTDPEDRAVAASLVQRFYPQLLTNLVSSADVVGGKAISTQPTPLQRLYEPRNVAVIGASEDLNQVGGAVLKALAASDFGGEVIPVVKDGRPVQGLDAAATIGAAQAKTKGKTDLAMITVDALEVPAALEDCGRNGVENVIVMSQGFEKGDGLKALAQLGEIADRHGINLVGPNSLGILTPRLNASYAKSAPNPGQVGLLSQSGAVVTGFLSDLKGTGFSKVVALGNQARLDIADFAADMAQDSTTRVITGYVESIIDGPKFIDTFSRITRDKPVVMLKSGKSEAGAAASMSHTGSLGGSNVAYDAAFRKAGCLVADDLEELADLSRVFGSNQALPKGNRIAVVTNTGGLGILAADEAEKRGLQMAELSQKTRAALKKLLPATAGFGNPIDVLGNAQSARYRAVTEVLLADPSVDGVMCLVSPQSMTDPENIARAMTELSGDKPIISSFIGQSDMAVANFLLESGGVPNFGSCERAVRAMGRMAEYARIKARPSAEPAPVDVDSAAVAAAKRAFGYADGGDFGAEAAPLLGAYSIDIPQSHLCADVEAAVAAAKAEGFPVVMKIYSPDILHKSDVGGVEIGIGDEGSLRRLHGEMMARVKAKEPGARIEGVEIRRHFDIDRELIVGINRDPVFGPTVMLGLGGIFVETFKDTAFEIAPLTDAAIDSMISRLQAYPILAGTRGQRAIDFDALRNVLRRISKLAVDNPAIAELEINPLVVSPEGATALDVRARVDRSNQTETKGD